MGAGPDAVPAPDTFGVVGAAEHVHIHAADPAARAAGGAPVLIDGQAAEGAQAFLTDGTADPAAVEENRRRIASAVGVDPEKMV